MKEAVEAGRRKEVDRAKAEAMATETIAATNESIRTHQEATSHGQIARRAWELLATRQRDAVSVDDRDDRWQIANDMAVQYQREAGSEAEFQRLTAAEETEVEDLCTVLGEHLAIIVQCLSPDETPLEADQLTLSTEGEARECLLCADGWKEHTPRIPPVPLRTKYCSNAK